MRTYLIMALVAFAVSGCEDRFDEYISKRVAMELYFECVNTGPTDVYISKLPETTASKYFTKSGETIVYYESIWIDPEVPENVYVSVFNIDANTNVTNELVRSIISVDYKKNGAKIRCLYDGSSLALSVTY